MNETPWKKSFGFHPLAASCANPHVCLAMRLRTGSAGSNRVADHLKVLATALVQVPRRLGGEDSS